MTDRTPSSRGKRRSLFRVVIEPFGRLLVALNKVPDRHLDWVAIALVSLGLWLRLRSASLTHLQNDEVFQVYLGSLDWPAIWYSSLPVTQPPLLVLLLHLVGKLNDSDMAFRLISVLAGSACPWIAYRWLGLVWSRGAGLFAIVVLAFSPKLILLGSIVRPYALAMALTTLALYAFERSIRDGSWRWMVIYSLSLWLAAWSVYSTAFFCATMAVYALLRFREPGFTRLAKALWVGAQAVILGSYGYLLAYQVIPMRAGRQHLVTSGESYFIGMFPSEGDNPLEFLLRGSFGQLCFTFNTKTVAAVAAVLLVTGIGLLVLRWRRRSLTMALAGLSLMVLPFLSASIGAYARAYPFGNSRQTVFLALFFAIGIGVSLDRLVRSKAWIAAPLALILTPFWWHYGNYRLESVYSGMDRSTWFQMLDFVEQEIPKGDVILTEQFSFVTLSYYLKKASPAGRIERRLYHAGRMRNLDEIWADLAEFRRKQNLEESEKVWVLDADDYCPLCRLINEGRVEMPAEVRVIPFGRVGTILDLPAGYTGPPPAATE